jgi:hypothetical protein
MTFLKCEMAVRTLLTLRVNFRVSVLPVVTAAKFMAEVMLSVTEILNHCKPEFLKETFCLLTNLVPFNLIVVVSVVTEKLLNANNLDTSFRCVGLALVIVTVIFPFLIRFSNAVLSL